VLRVSNLRGVLGARIEAGDDWGASLTQYPGMAMHAVLLGEVWVGSEQDQPLHLVAGDVVLMPRGLVHTLSDLPDGPPQEAVPLGADGAGELVSAGSGPMRTRILTIFYDCDHATRTQVVDELSGPIRVAGGEGGLAYLRSIMQLLEGELSHPQLATTAVVDNLIGVLLIQVIRAWVESRPARIRGTWLGWADDDVVRDAVALIHERPDSGWTTSTLARAVSVSRATLARRFATAVGLTPSDYMAQWRMDLAALRLRQTTESVETIAARVGYRSVPSFTRAFARDRGCTPGAYRDRSREHTQRTQEAWETAAAS
jgi:AraC-like DNA-binding protein